MTVVPCATWLKEKKSSTFIFDWSTFSLDYCTVTVNHFQRCEEIDFCSSRSCLIYERVITVQSLLWHIPKILSGSQFWTLCGPIHFMFPELLLEKVSWNPALSSLASSTKKKKPGHLVYLGRLLFNLNLINWKWRALSRWRFWFCLASWQILFTLLQFELFQFKHKKA